MINVLFPAYAGVIPEKARAVLGTITFPRIRGGDPFFSLSMLNLLIFSPHTRG